MVWRELDVVGNATAPQMVVIGHSMGGASAGYITDTDKSLCQGQGSAANGAVKAHLGFIFRPVSVWCGMHFCEVW
jgi:hypothetical protein